MIFKIIGSVIVICAFSFLGYVFSRDCDRRPQQLRILQGLLQMFESEINYLSNLLTDSFEKIYESSDNEVSAIFKATIDNLRTDKGLTAAEAWAKAVEENTEKTALNKEDKQILLSFGKMLGNSDIDGQVKNIRLTLSQLKLQEDKAEEIKRKNGSMYKTLGVLGGLAVVIVLF